MARFPFDRSHVDELAERLDFVRRQEAYISGAVALDFDETGNVRFRVPYEHAMEGRGFYETFEEAQHAARRVGLVEGGGFRDAQGYRSMDLSHFDQLNIDNPEFRRDLAEILHQGDDAIDLATMTDQQVNELIGRNLEIFRFNHPSGTAAKEARRIFEADDDMMFFQDENKMAGLRIRGVKRDQLAELLSKHGFEIEPGSGKFLKRMKTLIGPKRVDFGSFTDTGKVRAVVFDPFDMPDEMKNILSDVIESRTPESEKFVSRITSADEVGQMKQLRFLQYMDNEGFFQKAAKDVLGESVVSESDDVVADLVKLNKTALDRNLVEEVSRKVVDDLMAFQAFDGGNLMAIELVRDAIDDVKEKIAEKPANVQRYKQQLEELQTLNRKGAVANIRLSGPVIEALEGVTGLDLSQVSQGKGNVTMTWRRHIAAALPAGHEDVDVLMPKMNVSTGVAGSRKASIVTAEPHPISPVYADRTSVASGLVERGKVVSELERMREGVEQLSRIVSRGEPIQQGSPAYRMFLSVMEQTRSTSKVAEEILQSMERTKTVPSAQVPRALKFMRESLRKKGAPRILMSDHMARSSMTSQELSVLAKIEGAEDLAPGQKALGRAGLTTMTSADILTTYLAHGGPDLDDTLQHILQYDPQNKRVYSIDYRNPVTGDELSRVEIQGGLKSPRVRDHLRGLEAFQIRSEDAGLKEVRSLLGDLEMGAEQEQRLLERLRNIPELEDLMEEVGDARNLLAVPQSTIDEFGLPLDSRKSILKPDIEEEVMEGLERFESRLLHETAEETFDRPGAVRGRGYRYADLDLVPEATQRELTEIIGAAMYTPESEISRQWVEAQGVTRIIGGRESVARLDVLREPDLLRQAAEQDKVLGKEVSKIEKFLYDDVLESLGADKRSGMMLGKWVNAKAFLDSFLNINESALAAADLELVKDLIDIRQNLIMEESIIDVSRTTGLSEAQIADIDKRTDRIYRSVLGIVARQPEDSDLKISKAMFELMPKQVEGRDYIDMNAERLLTDKDAYSLMEYATQEFEESYEAMEKMAARQYLDIPISRSAKEEVERVRKELDELGDVGTHIPQERLSALRARMLERELYENLEYVTVDGKTERRFSAAAAEFYVGMSRTRFGAYMPNLAFVDNIEGLIEGTVDPAEMKTAREMAQQAGRYLSVDEYFQADFQQAIGKSLHDDISLVGEMYRHLGRSVEGVDLNVGQSIIGLTAEGDIKPSSRIVFGDGRFALAGEIAADPKRVAQELGFASRESDGVAEMAAAARRAMGDNLVELWEEAQRQIDQAEEFIDIGTARGPGHVPDEYDKTIMSAYEPDRHAPDPGITKRDAQMKRGGFLGDMRQALGDVPSRYKWGALALVAGSMIYNSVRDHEYRNEMSKVPETMPESTSPYDMGLMMPAGQRQPSNNAPVYQIRTRGGSIDDSLMREIQQVTGGANIDAFLFRDTLRTDSAVVASSILETYR